jgi:hypothetical protein
MTVRVPLVRDRGVASDGAPILFTFSMLPPYLRWAKSLKELLPGLSLKGISAGDFDEALTVLLGPKRFGLSASTIVRLLRRPRRRTWQDSNGVP